MDLGIRPLRETDRGALLALLAEAGLPTHDLASLEGFRGAFRAGRLLGCAGLDSHGAHRLLRSVAVRPEARGEGIGRRLVEEAIARARSEGAREIHLLTTDAAGWFERCGFRRIDRSSAPAEIRASSQFASACCSTAACMRLLLPPRGREAGR